jgi:ABC-type sugar transport system permease subunit
MWFNDRWLALGCNIASYVWKWMPFWTLIFLAGRMAIPREIHEAAEVDGATRFRRFVHVTFPLLANTYLICTLLTTIWALGEIFATLSDLESPSGENIRLMISVRNIQKTGCDIFVTTWNVSVVEAISVRWFAYVPSPHLPPSKR